MNNITTEAGDTIMLETVAGLASASSLNDISVVTINKERFATNPVSRGWMIGTDWEWDSVNERIKIA
jgi:hypothetical protein